MSRSLKFLTGVASVFVLAAAFYPPAIAAFVGAGL